VSQWIINESATDFDREPDPVPPFVMNWPEAELEMAGLTGRMMRGDCGTVLFMEAENDVFVPSHHHGAQWGVVLSGTMELTMNGHTQIYHPGDVHFIPAGVEHTARLFRGWRGMYIFESKRTSSTSRPG
jgi:mannose-6-phosphate isomerase-like protein (cupin superfamily)